MTYLCMCVHSNLSSHSDFVSRFDSNLVISPLTFRSTSGWEHCPHTCSSCFPGSKVRCQGDATARSQCECCQQRGEMSPIPILHSSELAPFLIEKCTCVAVSLTRTRHLHTHMHHIQCVLTHSHTHAHILSITHIHTHTHTC